MNAQKLPVGPDFATIQPLVLFDGVCSLCSGMVQFVLRHEKDCDLKFAPIQSELGERILVALGMPTDDYETVVVIDNGAVFLKSDAAFQIAKHLRAPWPVMAKTGSLCPAALRNWIYDRIASNRYRWFGRRASCFVASPDTRARFPN